MLPPEPRAAGIHAAVARDQRTPHLGFSVYNVLPTCGLTLVMTCSHGCPAESLHWQRF